MYTYMKRILAGISSDILVKERGNVVSHVLTFVVCNLRYEDVVKE